jgi:signal transduction histidine kinase
MVSKHPDFKAVLILGSYFLYAATFIRVVAFSVEQPPDGPLIEQMVVYGIVLFTQPLLGRRLRWYPWAYLALQSALTLGMLMIPPHFDFLPTLFYPLSMQAVSAFGWRTGLGWISGFTLILAVPIMINWDWQIGGLVMVGLYSGLNFFTGRLSELINREEKQRQETTRLLTELQAAHRQLLDNAAQVEEHSAVAARSKMAQELHDSVTQTIFSMNLSVQTARLLVDNDPARLIEQIDHLQELAHGANDEIQMLVSQLRPRSVVEGGLSAALRRLAAERKERDGLQVSLEISGEKILPEPVALGLYRIAQEGLNNIQKHARTDQAILRLLLDDRCVSLDIEDHGVGFVSQLPAPTPGHFGLNGMQSRAQELGWKLSVQSSPGQGTRIHVEESAK